VLVKWIREHSLSSLPCKAFQSHLKMITNVADLTLFINNTININNGLSVMLSLNKATFKNVK